jgi:hypothetical protein
VIIERDDEEGNNDGSLYVLILKDESIHMKKSNRELTADQL